MRKRPGQFPTHVQPMSYACCNGAIQQRWRLQGREVRSGGGKCLDVNLPMLRQNGGKVQVWSCNQSIQQSWSQPKSF